MDQELIKFLASLGVGGIIAGLMFMWYRKDIKAFTEQWQGQTELLMKVVQDNTKAMVSSNEIMRTLVQRLETVHDDTWQQERNAADRRRP